MDKFILDLVVKTQKELLIYLKQLNIELKGEEFYQIKQSIGFLYDLKNKDIDSYNKIFFNVYGICYENYLYVVKYLNQTNKELLQLLQARVKKKPRTIIDIYNIISFFDKLNEFNIGVDIDCHKENVLCVFLGDYKYYINLFKSCKKINTFYYTLNVNNKIFHIMNVLGIKVENNDFASTPYEEAIYYMKSMVFSKVEISKVLIFGLCAGFKNQFNPNMRTNDIILPHNLNSMFTQGESFILKIHDLLKLRKNEIFKVENIFSLIKEQFDLKYQTVYDKQTHLSTSNLYTKYAFGEGICNYFVNTNKYSEKDIEKSNCILEKKYKLANSFISKKYSSLDMEVFQIVQDLKRYSIGIYLQVADVIDVFKEEHSLDVRDGVFHLPLDVDVFNKNIIKIINLFSN